MTGRTRNDREVKQDIHSAELLLSLAHGLTREESAVVLEYRAAVRGLSVHAAAVGVLTPGEETPDAGPSSPERPRHLFAVPSGQETDAG